jgi:hypothetical protein
VPKFRSDASYYQWLDEQDRQARKNDDVDADFDPDEPDEQERLNFGMELLGRK